MTEIKNPELVDDSAPHAHGFRNIKVPACDNIQCLDRRFEIRHAKTAERQAVQELPFAVEPGIHIGNRDRIRWIFYRRQAQFIRLGSAPCYFNSARIGQAGIDQLRPVGTVIMRAGRSALHCVHRAIRGRSSNFFRSPLNSFRQQVADSLTVRDLFEPIPPFFSIVRGILETEVQRLVQRGVRQPAAAGEPRAAPPGAQSGR